MKQQRRQDNDILKLLCLILWSNNVKFGKEEYALLMNPFMNIPESVFSKTTSIHTYTSKVLDLAQP